MKTMNYIFISIAIFVVFIFVAARAPETNIPASCQPTTTNSKLTPAETTKVLVCGPSMEPTLHDGDYYKASLYDGRKALRRGMLVACSLDCIDELVALGNVKPTTTLFVKRVVGLPGDVITFNEFTHTLYINGSPYEEDYLNESAYSWGIDTVVVQEGYIFVLGDNRNHSTDSRAFGCVPQSAVIYICSDEHVS